MDLRKKIWIPAAVLVLLMGLCACGKANPMPQETKPQTVQTEDREQTRNPEETVLWTEEAASMEETVPQVPTEAAEPCGSGNHTWREAVYTWIYEDGACRAERGCENCEATQFEIAVASCSAEGTGLLITARFENAAFESQSKIKQTSDGQGCFTVSNAVGKPGETVEVTLSIQNNPGIIALALDVAYDAQCLELLEVKDGALLPGGMFSDNLGKNPYYLGWNDALASEDYCDDGVLATLVFRIRDDAKPDATHISVVYSPGDVINRELKDQIFSVVNGIVAVEEAGDAQTVIPVPKDPTVNDT